MPFSYCALRATIKTPALRANIHAGLMAVVFSRAYFVDFVGYFYGLQLLMRRITLCRYTLLGLNLTLEKDRGTRDSTT